MLGLVHRTRTKLLHLRPALVQESLDVRSRSRDILFRAANEPAHKTEQEFHQSVSKDAGTEDLDVRTGEGNEGRR